MDAEATYWRMMDKMQARGWSAGPGLHSHHILPRSLGGDNEPDNLVVLTPREHFIAHRLLARIYGGGMIRAIQLMWVKSGDAHDAPPRHRFERAMEHLRKTGLVGPKKVPPIRSAKASQYNPPSCTLPVALDYLAKRADVDFAERLDAIGLDKIALASRLGLSVETVYKWRNSPPQYALAYVELLERMRAIAKELMG